MTKPIKRFHYFSVDEGYQFLSVVDQATTEYVWDQLCWHGVEAPVARGARQVRESLNIYFAPELTRW